MNQDFDVKHAMKTLRWMPYYCTATMVMFAALGLFSGHYGSSVSVAMFMVTVGMTILGPMGAVLSMVFGMFQYQQSEIANLKQAIEGFQSANHPAENALDRPSEGFTTT